MSGLRFTHWIDESEKPSWGVAADGCRVNIEADDRFGVLFTEWQADSCDHPRNVVVRWVNGGGAWMHQRFCYDCGNKTSQFLKKEDAEREGVTDVSKDLLASKHKAYENDRSSRLERLANEAAERCQPANRRTYDDYLRSPEWKRKAELILRRANHTCEGCLSRPATQVHHLTYTNIYNEFAWELRAVCDPCHSRAHKEAAQ